MSMTVLLLLLLLLLLWLLFDDAEVTICYHLFIPMEGDKIGKSIEEDEDEDEDR